MIAGKQSWGHPRVWFVLPAFITVSMDRKTIKPDGLLVAEAKLPLRINGLRAVDFIRRAYDLGDDCNGVGRFDLDDPVQTELRHIEGWIKMAQSDALDTGSAALAGEDEKPPDPQREGDYL